MENRSDTDSSKILGDWDLTPPIDPEGIIMVSVPTSPESDDTRSEKETEAMVSDKERGSTSNVAGGGFCHRGLIRRGIGVMGNGKKNKEKENKEIHFKEIIEALLRNSGDKVVKEESTSKSCVEMLKAMGLKFP